MEDNKDKIPEDIKKEVTGKIDELKKVKDGSDVEAIKSALAELNKTVTKIGQAMYQQQQAQSAAGAAAGNSQSQPNDQQAADGAKETVEGDYEEVKKN